MAGTVKCDICGRVYNQKYLTAHKRLAHGRPQNLVLSGQSEPETVAAIVSIYARLSENVRKELRERLAHAEETMS